MPEPNAIATAWPLLSLMLLTPLLGVLLLLVWPRPGQARWIALGATLATLCQAVMILVRFDSALASFQLLEESDWVPTLGIRYLVGVDGMAVLFLPLTAVLFCGVIAASWTGVRNMPRLYFSLLLLLLSATLGIFCALDLVLFFLFWEMTLIPAYFLISLWGPGPHRRYAAIKYTLFMLGSGIPLLFAFLLLAFNHASLGEAGVPAGLSWDYRQLLQTPLSHGDQVVVFLLLLAGFAVKTPLFPLHTWVPVVSMESPTAITAVLLGVKLGAYGVIRFAVPLAPAAAQELHWLLAGLGVLGILYGALAALAQTNLRRMLAYASFSHVGLVLLGVSSFDLAGAQGALYQLLNFTIVAGGLFLLTGFLHQRVGSTELISLGGAAHSMPRLAALMFLLFLAALGIPGTAGFPAEFLILMSALNSHTGAGLAALAGMVLGAGYTLASFRRTFYGPAHNQVVATAVDLRGRELLVAVGFALLVLLGGLYPAGVLNITGAASAQWAERLQQSAH